MRRALVTLAALALITGCGNERQSPPDVFTPGPPLGANQASYPAAGLAFKVPGGWSKVDGTQQYAVATISTGAAVIGIWRFPQPNRQLPTTGAQLNAAILDLINAAKARNPSFVPIKSTHVTISGKPGVQVRGTENVDGQPRMVRSTHVYTDGAEIVIDAFCPAVDFKRVDGQVFRPMLQTVQITTPPAGA